MENLLWLYISPGGIVVDPIRRLHHNPVTTRPFRNAGRDNRPVRTRLGILAACTTIAVSACSSSGGGQTKAAADVRAACALVNDWASRTSYTNGAQDQMLFTVQRDTDRAASEDPQWKGLAADVSAYRSTLSQWRAENPMGGDATDLNMAWGTVVSDCKAVAASSS